MPGLDLEALRYLNRCEPRRCQTCEHPVRRNYCRECDEFFEAGHMVPVCKAANGGEHEGHRTY